MTPKELEKLSSAGDSFKIAASAVEESETKTIYENPIFKNKEVLKPVTQSVFRVTAEKAGKSDGDKLVKPSAPVAIKIDLSDQELTETEIAKLSGVRYETGANGELVLVKCGGVYDKETKAFTFYTDGFGQCGVVKDEHLKKLSLFVNDTYTLKNDQNDQLDAPPEIVNNRTMVPLRYIAESLGTEVQWEGATQTITMMKDGKTITLTVGETTEDMDTAPMIKNSRTMVPVRYISEQFGANVMWFEETQKIDIIQ